MSSPNGLFRKPNSNTKRLPLKSSKQYQQHKSNHPHQNNRQRKQSHTQRNASLPRNHKEDNHILHQAHQCCKEDDCGHRSRSQEVHTGMVSYENSRGGGADQCPGNSDDNEPNCAKEALTDATKDGEQEEQESKSKDIAQVKRRYESRFLRRFPLGCRV